MTTQFSVTKALYSFRFPRPFSMLSWINKYNCRSNYFSVFGKSISILIVLFLKKVSLIIHLSKTFYWDLFYKINFQGLKKPSQNS